MKKPKLKAHDIHLVMNAKSRLLKCYDVAGTLKWQVLARAEGIAGPGWSVQNGDTPPGLYSCGQIIPWRPEEGPEVRETYGPYFIVLVDEEARARGGHTGVGLHSGRDRSPGRPPRRALELMVTHGCIRVDDDDMVGTVEPAVRYTQKHGGTAWLTVVQE